MTLKSIYRTRANAFLLGKTSELSRNVAVASDKNQGIALALMGVALAMLATDLLAHELKASALPSSRA